MPPIRKEPTPHPEPTEKAGMAGRPLLKSDPMSGAIIQQRYAIQDLIGEGGMGKIYSALDLNSQTKVAIKIMNTSDPSAKERFLIEARAMADIRHKNVIRIFAADEYKGRPYMVVEYLDGKDLKTYLRDNGPLNWEDTRRIMLQVCDGIGAAHAKGIMHRDLKPPNIFIVENEGREIVKVLDFGIAKFMDRQDGPHTATGMFAGTPQYAAPEQITKRDSMDHRVDIYALGIIMHNMLTGEVPFSSNKADQDAANLEVLMMQIHNAVVPPSVRYPQLTIPKAAEDIILKAMQKNKEDRYANIGELREAILHGEDISLVSLGGDLLRVGLDEKPDEPIVRTPPPRHETKAAGSHVARKLLLTAVLAGMSALAVSTYQDLSRFYGPYYEKLKARVTSTMQDAPRETAPPEQVQNTVPAEKKFAIKINSDPAGSFVYDVTSEKEPLELGVTPLRMELPDGNHRLLIKSRDRKQEARLVISPGHAEETVTFKRQPKTTHAPKEPTEEPASDKAAEDDDSTGDDNNPSGNESDDNSTN